MLGGKQSLSREECAFALAFAEEKGWAVLRSRLPFLNWHNKRISPLTLTQSTAAAMPPEWRWGRRSLAAVDVSYRSVCCPNQSRELFYLPPPLTLVQPTHAQQDVGEGSVPEPLPTLAEDLKTLPSGLKRKREVQVQIIYYIYHINIHFQLFF
jgi:hypothetical protein